jgi:hypothetical protein
MFNSSKFIEIPKNKYLEYAKKSAFYEQLSIAAKAGISVYTNEVNKLNNTKHAQELNGKISIKDIFIDNWSDFVLYCKSRNKTIRESILINVDKMIHCKDWALGYLYFDCPNCGNFHIQGFSCHSRFCVSCGKKYRDARANEIAATCIHVPHRHITWTIAQELRIFFRLHKELYDELFNAVNDVLTFIIWNKSKTAKERNERLGYISTIHTFGRDMKFNPHIHSLVAECTIDKYGVKRNYFYFNYESLRKAFKNQLLKRIYRFLKKYGSLNELKRFVRIRNELYTTKNSEGFYVHAPQNNIKNPEKIKKIVNYVCRYAGHPAMSESRILDYNKDTKEIYYYYDPHEDDAIIDDTDKIGRQYIREHVFKFISKLIVHIPEKNVHTTRYYGFYSNHTSLDISNKNKLYSYYELKKMNENLSWRKRLLNSYKYDPILCYCGTVMNLDLDHSYFPKRKDIT